tara:strand:- start:10207 stop:10404 length:198 start_codon:yes stop_codon:yes gene_type:complete
MDEEIVARVKEILGEYYPNYLIVVLDEEGEVQSSCTSFSVGRMLLKEASLEYADENTEIIYEEDE